ncbi:hypothetical protein Q4489_17445 [Thalassotalea sp. 1_MG-2023]|uniref:hypothetical protein n=1 Tax=Thalassotalea sp. 1_MG-2023 TaxID=3062680 RepID=UPI0026E3ED72|nr:hypothetical protein [Thalassotalea sp. 1_MG-2023]MDO6428797.1 hypothetical protein [Thalassotalea sp. 1_MG-2023]
MLDISQLQTLQKRSAKSYHQQKKLIANVLKGQKECCPHCEKPLSINVDYDQGITKIRCKAACTDIELEH